MRTECGFTLVTASNTQMKLTAARNALANNREALGSVVLCVSSVYARLFVAGTSFVTR
jgi:hypothetical protein